MQDDIDWLTEELSKSPEAVPLGQQEAANNEAALDVKPEVEAEIDQLSSDLSMEREQVRADQDNLRSLNERDKAVAAAQDTPVTKSILENPLQDGAAQDDTGVLGDIERIFINAPKKGFERGQAMVELSDLGYAAYQSGEIGSDYLAKIAELESLMQEETGADGFFQEIPAVIGEQLPIMGSLLWGAKEEMGLGAAVGTAFRNPLRGLGAGAKYGMAMETAKMEAGFAFNDVIRMVDENGKPMPIEAARAAALIVGIANGSADLLAFGPMMRAVPGGDKLLKAMTNRKSLEVMMKRPAFRDALMSFGKRFAYGAVAEAGTEGVQEVMQVMAQDIAAAFAGDEFTFDLPEAGDYAQAAGAGARMGLQAAFGFVVPGASIATTFDYRGKKAADDRRTAFEVLAEKSTDSKLRERLPERFKSFVNSVQEKHGTVSEVYVDVEAAETFFQEFTDAEIKEQMPDAYESLKEARVNGGDVVIPVGEFATYMAPSEQFAQMAGDMKFDINDLTPKQLEDVGGEVEAAKQEVLKSIADGESTDVASIFEDFKTKLEGVGYTGDSAALQAQLVQSVIGSIAEMGGMDAQAFYDQFNIDLANQFNVDPDMQGMEQAEWLSALDKFGEEGMTQEARMERAREMGFDVENVWHHGTDKIFDSFDGMTFMTEHAGEASAYAATNEFRGNLRRESFLSKVTEGELSSEEFGVLPYTGIVADIDGEGLWATDSGVVRVTGSGRNKTVQYMSNAVVDYEAAGDATTATVVEGQSKAFSEAVEMADLDEVSESSPQIISAYIREGKFKELGPLEANILGARLRGNMTEGEQAKYDKLLQDIEVWKEEGYIGISTVSDDIGFGSFSEEGAPAQRIIFDPSNIRSVNAAFDPDAAASPNLLEQAAYHGTPHLFDKFSLQFMGEGEGAQAYGWGMYFAGNRKIADFYREQLSEGTILENISIGGLEIFKDGGPADYGPEQYGGEAGATLVEELLIEQWKIEEAYQADGVDGVKSFVEEKINERVEFYQDELTNYPDSREWAEDGMAFLESIREQLDDITIDAFVEEGNLYEVDLPEDSELLDYDKPLSEQPESVQKAAMDAWRSTFENPDEAAVMDFDGSVQSRRSEHSDAEWAAVLKIAKVQGNKVSTLSEIEGQSFGSGYGLYEALKKRINFQTEGNIEADRAASLLLSEHGIPGLTYKDAMSRGGEDIQTNNYVIWDEDRIHIDGVNDEAIHQLFQGEQKQARGFIQFNDARDYFKITLTGKADLSTFLHESGHMFLEMMSVAASSPNATPQIKADLARIRDWIGASPSEALTRDHHEKFARGFEAYLMEGKAPNAKLVDAFIRFRSWLTQVYKNMQTLLDIEGIELSDDIRGVFDRLVGADDAFQRQMGDYQPAFKNAAEAGMTEGQYATYVEVHHKAMLAAKDQLDREAVADARRQHQSDYLKRKAELVESITDEVDAEPAQNVKRYLRAKNKDEWTNVPEELHPYRLSAGAVKHVLGVDKVPSALTRYIVNDDGAAHPDDLAQLFNFKNGAEMLAAMIEAPPRKETIDSQVQSQLQEEFGDYRYDGKLDDVAIEKLHSNKMGQHIMAEVRAISRRVGAPFSTSQMAIARLAAREHVAGIPITKLRPQKYLNAEKKAAKAAADAVAAEDFNEALVQKLRQMSNHQMYRAAKDAQNSAEKVRNRLNEVDQMIRRKNNYIGKAGDHYRDAIIALLQGVELRRVSGAKLDKRALLQSYLDKMEAEGEAVYLPESHLDALNMTNYKSMTLNDLLTLRDSVDRIAKTAKLKNELQSGKEKRDLREFVAESIGSMEKNAKKVKQKNIYRETLRSKAVDQLLSWQAALTKIEFIAEWIDGSVAGNFHRVFFQPFVDAQEKEFDMMVDLTKRVQTQLKRTQNLNRDVVFLGEDMTMQQVYAVALNMGNEGNFKKLIEGYGWSREQVVSEVQKHMTETDFEIVQELWDIVNSIWPEMQDVYMRAHGVRPPKVQASELHLEELGITLRGGYYPIVYESRKKTQFQSKAGVEGLFENNLFKPNVSAGFMETRTQFVDPIKLDLSPLGSHLNETVHFLTHYEAVRNADKIIKDNEFAKAFIEHFGKEHYDVLSPWLKNIADNGKTQEGVLDDVARRARVGTSIVAMGANIGSGLMQGLGWFTTADVVGFKYTAKHIMTSAFNPTAWKFATEHSGEIRHIDKTADREIRSVVDQMFTASRFEQSRQSLQRFAFMHIMMVQKMVNVSTFMAAYDKGMSEHGSHEQAVREGEATVRKTQSGAGVKDLAKIQTGTQSQQIFVAFYTYFSVLFNRERNMVREAKKGNFGQSLMSFWWLLLGPVIFESFMRGKGPDEEDDEGWAEFYAKNSFAYAMTSIPVVGAVASAAVSDFPFRASPAVSMLDKSMDSTVRLAGRVFEGEDITDSMAMGTLNLLGVALGLPVSPIKRGMLAAEEIDEAPVRAFIFGQRSED